MTLQKYGGPWTDLAPAPWCVSCWVLTGTAPLRACVSSLRMVSRACNFQYNPAEDSILRNTDTMHMTLH